MCKCLSSDAAAKLTSAGSAEAWHELDLLATGDDLNEGISNRPKCFWKEVTEAHSPGREDERARIEKSNGWITTEKEIPIGQLRRMDLFDQDVIDILQRCLLSNPAVGSQKEYHAAPQRIINHIQGLRRISC